MGSGFIVVIILEVALFFIIMYGLVHEDRLIQFEDEMLLNMRKKFRSWRKSREESKYTNNKHSVEVTANESSSS